MGSRLMRAGALAILALGFGGCVATVPMTSQAPDPGYVVGKPVLVVVTDERDRVKLGKAPTFIGLAHASFGIPVDWHVNPVLAVTPPDKTRTFAQFLENRLVTGLTTAGWPAVEVGPAPAVPAKGAKLVAPTAPDEAQIERLLAQHSAGSLVLLRVQEWYFSINLNWVTAFNLDTDTIVSVYRPGQGMTFTKRIGGRDVVDVQASQSPRNHILMAYRDQLTEIIRDPDLRQALSGTGAPTAAPAPAPTPTPAPAPTTPATPATP